MTQILVAHVGALRIRFGVWASNAWTRSGSDEAAARRIAGLRYWDGACLT